MGYASFMVTIRYAEDLFPKAYFFGEHDLAKRFFEAEKDVHEDDGSSVQLWTLDVENAKWELTAFN